ncbi:DUF2526 family protein [Herbiconiux daphne]|uniref:DUF2526 family protein n=1 Tax=Herbiconiux daphne TaxID=2970914 RepID=A0ABT2HBD1_9MICO|nr:DUF2526 family protein [Herbiconiux daphne]MCS5737242.1 DUF2526 family protein [Herbiconiux daphne]
MAHNDDVIAAVDKAIELDVIIGMNTLLCALSEDTELDRDFRYEQQMRLRRAVYNHGLDVKKRREWEADQRRQQLTRGGIIV